MKVTSFLACAYASYTTENLVDLSGVGLDRILTNKFPVSLRLRFFARCESEITDLPGHHKAEVVLMGEDKVLSRSPTEFDTTEDQRNAHIIVDMGFTFESPARYRVDFVIAGKSEASWPLEVRRAGAALGSPPA